MWVALFAAIAAARPHVKINEVLDQLDAHEARHEAVEDEMAQALDNDDLRKVRAVLEKARKPDVDAALLRGQSLAQLRTNVGAAGVGPERDQWPQHTALKKKLAELHAHTAALQQKAVAKMKVGEQANEDSLSIEAAVGGAKRFHASFLEAPSNETMAEALDGLATLQKQVALQKAALAKGDISLGDGMGDVGSLDEVEDSATKDVAPESFAQVAPDEDPAAIEESFAQVAPDEDPAAIEEDKVDQKLKALEERTRKNEAEYMKRRREEEKEDGLTPESLVEVSSPRILEEDPAAIEEDKVDQKLKALEERTRKNEAEYMERRREEEKEDGLTPESLLEEGSNSHSRVNEEKKVVALLEAALENGKRAALDKRDITSDDDDDNMQLKWADLELKVKGQRSNALSQLKEVYAETAPEGVEVLDPRLAALSQPTKIMDRHATLSMLPQA